jgi:transcriptional regulator with XRE-family HTH domain
MRITPELTNEDVLHEMGVRIARRRIGYGMTQAMLAEEAGIGKRTLERIERGESAQVATLIRVLRRLGSFNELDMLVPEPSNEEALDANGRLRQRASPRAA